MKTFRFHLQKIVDLKEKEQEQAEWAFGRSVQIKTEEEAKLVHLTNRREVLTESIHQMQANTCTAAELIQMTRFQQAIDKAIVRQKNTVFGCEREVERCQTTLTKKMQETKLWDKLKEKEHQRFTAAVNYHEQQALDEIGLIQYVRR